MPVDEFKKKIDALGYDLRSFEIDDGGFKTRIVDRQSRLPVKAKFDTVSGELLRVLNERAPSPATGRASPTYPSTSAVPR